MGGLRSCIFLNWEDCREWLEGNEHAEYSVCESLEAANLFIVHGENQVENKLETNQVDNKLETNPVENKLKTNQVDNKLETNQVDNELETNQVQHIQDENDSEITVVTKEESTQE